MKFKLDPHFFKFSLYGFLTIAMAILFFMLLNNLGFYIGIASSVFLWIRRVLSPFFIGTLVAYILNPAMRWLERNAFQKTFSTHRARRIFSVASVYLCLMGIVALLLVFVIPQISNNVSELIRSSPEYIRVSNRAIRDWLVQVENFADESLMQQINQRIASVLSSATSMAEQSLQSAFFGIFTFTSGVLNFIMALVISFYLLLDKESFKLGLEKILRLLFSKNQVERLKDLGREVDDLFSKFIVGKSLDSFIIAIICFIGLNVLDIRYALLITLIVGITNMIPYFGPFIGAVPAVFITLFDSPIKALWVALFIFALQQFDGWILGPKILGDSVGVSPFWIILSIIVGGKLFGLLGMFLGVPAVAVLRLLAIRFIDRRLDQRVQVPGENEQAP